VTDQAVAAAQIGRPLRAEVAVAARCDLELPVVVAVPPLLDDGTPFPTRLWLSCPLAVARVARLESAGGVRRLDAYVKSSPDLTAALEAAHVRYAAERDAQVPAGADPMPGGGVGGTHGEGLKCLHAHYADTAAGNPNPVGEAVRPFVEPLDCAVPCVDTGGSEVVRNPEWEEPG
jgi:hypothetical protein